MLSESDGMVTTVIGSSVFTDAVLLPSHLGTSFPLPLVLPCLVCLNRVMFVSPVFSVKKTLYRIDVTYPIARIRNDPHTCCISTCMTDS